MTMIPVDPLPLIMASSQRRGGRTLVTRVGIEFSTGMPAGPRPDRDRLTGFASKAAPAENFMKSLLCME